MHDELKRLTAGSMRRRRPQQGRFCDTCFSPLKRIGAGRAFGELEIDMDDVSMSASDLLDLMKWVAQLHRGFAGRIELQLAHGIIIVPGAIFDALAAEPRIVPDGRCSYRLG